MKLTPRRGGRPTTTPTNPHTQLDQQPTDPGIRLELAARVFALPDVEEQLSGISVPGARALCLCHGAPIGPSDAFMIGREFAHLHPDPDMSLHAMLPPDLVEETIDAEWAELHPVARAGLIPPTAVMVYAPRDAEELEIVSDLVTASHEFAHG